MIRTFFVVFLLLAPTIRAEMTFRDVTAAAGIFERRLRQRLRCRAGVDDWYKYQLCRAPDGELQYVFPNTRGPLRNKRLVAVIWTAPPR